MSKKLFYSLLMIACLIFAVISIGGCGGSSSSNPEKTTGSGIIGSTIKIDFDRAERESAFDPIDVDGNGRPDALDLYGAQILRFGTGSSLAPDENGVYHANGTVPLAAFIEELADPNEPDEITVSLKAGTYYTAEFSKNFAFSLGATLPQVEIIDPNGNAFEGSIQHSNYPQADPSLICLTFRPEVAGNYTFKISSANVNSVEDVQTNCVFFLYEEMFDTNDTTVERHNGYPFRFTYDEYDEEKVYTVSAVLELRRLILAADPSLLKNAYGAYESEEERQEYELYGEYIETTMMKALIEDEDILEVFREINGDMIQPESLYTEEDIKDFTDEIEGSVHSAAAVDWNQVSEISGTLLGIPYEPMFSPGAGFFATSMMEASGGAAIDNFQDLLASKAPATKSGITTKYTATCVSSQEEYSRRMSTGVNVSGGLGTFGLSVSTSKSNNIKFGLTSATMIIHYEELEPSYRQLSNAEYLKYQTDNAKAVLGFIAEDMDAHKGEPNYANYDFRKEFGDYFVAGYQYGGCFDAFITLTTESREQLKQLTTAFEAKLQGLESTDLNAGVNVSNDLQEMVKKYGAQVTVDIRTIGAGNNIPTSINLPNSHDISAVGNVITELVKFRNALANSMSPKDYAPVNVMLKRYRFLSYRHFKAIPLYIDVPARITKTIANFNASMYRLTGYYNILVDAKNSKTIYNMPQDLSDKYNDIINDAKALRNAFFTDEKNLNNGMEKVNDLLPQLRDLSDRYSFFTMLVNARKNEQPDGDNYPLGKTLPKDEPRGGASGYPTFYASEVVTADINAGKTHRDQKTEPNWAKNPAPSDEWHFSWNAEEDAGKGAIFCYVEVIGDNDNDNYRRVSPAGVVGRSVLRFDFKSGVSRSYGWYVRAQSMKFGQDYPFSNPDFTN